jgi:hypothetical protein
MRSEQTWISSGARATPHYSPSQRHSAAQSQKKLKPKRLLANKNNSPLPRRPRALELGRLGSSGIGLSGFESIHTAQDRLHLGHRVWCCSQRLAKKSVRFRIRMTWKKVGVMMWPSWVQRASGLLGPCILEPAGPWTQIPLIELWINRAIGPTGPRAHGSKSSRVQWPTGPKVQGSRQGPTGPKVQGSKGPRVHKFKGPRAHGSKSSRVQGLGKCVFHLCCALGIPCTYRPTQVSPKAEPELLLMIFLLSLLS